MLMVQQAISDGGGFRPSLGHCKAHPSRAGYGLMICLLLLGLVGVGSLILVPFEALVSLRISPIALRLLATVQPAILTAFAVIIGSITAPKVGLHAPMIEALLERRAAFVALSRQALPALIVGVTAALILIVYGHTVGAQLMRTAGAHAKLASFDLPLATKLLYGGITEELLTRWGLVSLFCWAGWRLTGQTSPSSSVMGVAIIAAAALFAAGHLPLLFMISPGASFGIITAVLIANLVPGIMFGTLFVRYGLEAAIFAHMIAHLLSVVATTLG